MIWNCDDNLQLISLTQIHDNRSHLFLQSSHNFTVLDVACVWQGGEFEQIEMQFEYALDGNLVWMVF